MFQVSLELVLIASLGVELINNGSIINVSVLKVLLELMGAVSHVGLTKYGMVKLVNAIMATPGMLTGIVSL